MTTQGQEGHFRDNKNILYIDQVWVTLHVYEFIKTHQTENFKHPLVDEWIRKMWYLYTVEYYAAIKKDEIVTFVVTRMDLEGITLNEICQTEKDKYHVISLICGI